MIINIINKNISKNQLILKNYTRLFSTNTSLKKDIWLISDGVLENERQSIALAKSLKLDYEVYRIVRKKLMWGLPNLVQSWLVGWNNKNTSNKIDQVNFNLPWYLTWHSTSNQQSKSITTSNPPKFVISSGLETIVTVQDFKKKLPLTTQFVHINYPKIPFKHFDWIVLAKHERLKLAHLGPALSQQKNVILTQMMLNNTKESINQISNSKLHPKLSPNWTNINDSNSPTLGILVSGVHSEFLYLKEYADKFTRDLQILITKFGAQIVIYYNQETPQFIKKSIHGGLNELIQSNQNYKDKIIEYSVTDEDIKTSAGNDTLNHTLSLSSHLLVFAGNPILVSEAIATGKPVYLVGANHCRNSLASFNHNLNQNSYIRPFHVPKQYQASGDPLTYIGQHKPFQKFTLNETKLTVDQLLQAIEEKEDTYKK